MESGYSAQQSSTGSSDMNNIPFGNGPSTQQPSYTSPTLEDIQKSRNNDISTIRDQNSGVPEQTNPGVVSQDIINKMIPDIQSATARGYLSLPDRDIPRDGTQYTNDPSIQVNKEVHFSPETKDYIPTQSNTNTPTPARKKSQWDREFLYDELFTPIVAGIMFYIFSNDRGIEIIQRLIPSMFKSDGNMKKYGNLVVACIFSFTIYSMMKAYDYTSMNEL